MISGYDLPQPSQAEMLLELRKQMIAMNIACINRPLEVQQDLVRYVQAVGELIKWKQQFPELVPMTVEELQKRIKKLHE